MKIVLVGGGTGGHFYPLMAVAEVMRTQPNPPELYYLGPSPYDKAALATHGITYLYCPAGKIRVYFSLQNFLDQFRNFFGFFVAVYRLFIIYPDVVFSKGGYTSVPVVFAAAFLRIPIVIHESDAVPGRANKLAKSLATYIAISYDDVAPFFKAEKTALTGIPLRQEIITINQNPNETLGIPTDKPLLFVTGGSSGAERLNNIILRSLVELLPYYRVFHQAGSNNVNELRLSAQTLLAEHPELAVDYYLEGSVSGQMIGLLLDAAAVVITRAGSTTLFEIAAHGKPTIIIPIPEDISRDQRKNAYAFAENGAASVIEEKNLTPHLLIQEIHSIMNDPGRYEGMSAASKARALPGAAEKIATLLLQIGHEHESR